MTSFTKLLKISLLILLAAILTGCATDDSQSAAHAEGSLPWNRPAYWEGAGALGSAMQGTR
jgi:PBP1b-binding outer membrane lipoprotein LpoB